MVWYFLDLMSRSWSAFVKCDRPIRITGSYLSRSRADRSWNRAQIVAVSLVEWLVINAIKSVGANQCPTVGWGSPLHAWLASLNRIVCACCPNRRYGYVACGMHYHILLQQYSPNYYTYNIVVNNSYNLCHRDACVQISIRNNEWLLHYKGVVRGNPTRAKFAAENTRDQSGWSWCMRSSWVQVDIPWCSSSGIQWCDLRTIECGRWRCIGMLLCQCAGGIFHQSHTA